MSNTRKLFSNFASLSFVQVINFLIPLLVMPYLISRIGADGLGIVAIAQVVMTFLSTIADYGFNISATKDIALNKDNPSRIASIFYTVLACKLFISLFLFIGVLIAASLIPVLKNHFALYTLGFIYVFGQSLLPIWFYQGLERMHHITIYSLASRIIFLILVVLFIREKGDHIYFLFFIGVGNIIAGAGSIIWAIRKYQIPYYQPGKKQILQELANGWQVTISNISINTFLFSGIFILRIFSNDLIVGYYSIAERIYFAARQVLSIFSVVIYPRICQLTVQGKEASARFFKQVYFPFLMAIMAGSFMLYVFAHPVVSLFIHEETSLSVQLLKLLSFTPIIVCLNIPAYQLLLAMNKQRAYLMIYSLATLVNIVANFMLVKQLSAEGTVYSILITECFITVGLNIVIISKKLGAYILKGL